MFKLREVGLKPANIPTVLEHRVQFLGSLSEQNFWLDFIATVDGVAYPSVNSEFFGRFKLDRNSYRLLYVNPETSLVNGAIPISDEVYNKLLGPEFVITNVAHRDFALLANKFTAGRKYRREELYELGATPLGKHLGITKINRKEINEVENSDLLLALCHYDFKKDRNTSENQYAAALRNIYFNPLIKSDAIIKPLINIGNIQEQIGIIYALALDYFVNGSNLYLMSLDGGTIIVGWQPPKKTLEEIVAESLPRTALTRQQIKGLKSRVAKERTVAKPKSRKYHFYKPKT